MAFKFDKAFNKFAETNNSLNRGVNKIIGKEVFKEVKKIEAPREFPPYDSFPKYSVPEPEQWTPLTGAVKEFKLDGHTISVSENLDACMKYRKDFKTLAEYYTEQFKYMYQSCVDDFDSLIHYFSDIYLEGLMPMINRAYSLLLPFGIFSIDIETFTSKHIDTYKKAVTSYETVGGIESAKNQQAKNLGNLVGGSIQMQGGGFGVKGAAKGVAQAEIFNLGLGMLGKFVEHQSKMTKEEKAIAFAEFKKDIFFQEVYSDYFNTFLTMVQTLSENGELDNVRTISNTEFDTMVRNLQNPMFPQDKLALALVNLISSYPFEPVCFELLQNKFGQTEEVKQIIDYYVH